MKIYVASSWRNEFQPLVCAELREDGHEVYDFRHPAHGNDGFSWRSVDPEWQSWSPQRYIEGLESPPAQIGFALDMNALQSADLCVMVMPCGMSASLETGYAVGAGKRVAVYVPGMREPDLNGRLWKTTSGTLATSRWPGIASRPSTPRCCSPRSRASWRRAHRSVRVTSIGSTASVSGRCAQILTA